MVKDTAAAAIPLAATVAGVLAHRACLPALFVARCSKQVFTAASDGFNAGSWASHIRQGEVISGGLFFGEFAPDYTGARPQRSIASFWVCGLSDQPKSPVPVSAICLRVQHGPCLGICQPSLLCRVRCRIIVGWYMRTMPCLPSRCKRQLASLLPI